jgi:hypothetical protein
MAIDRNKARILRGYHRAVWNCIGSNQFAKAVEVNTKLTGIIKAWKCQQVGGTFRKTRSRKVTK